MGYRWNKCPGLVLFVAFVCAGVRGADCNQNGVADALDIEQGESPDCNGNGSPDECETGARVFEFRGVLKRVSFGPHAAVLADFDDDGDADLAVSAGSTHIVAFSNDGAGGLVTGPSVLIPSGGGLIFLASADVDGDRREDLITVSESSDSLHVLLNDGGLRFRRGPVLSTGRSPTAVAAGDLDGDGAVDLASADRGAGELSVFLNDGSGGFGERRGIEVGGEPVAVVLSDLNGDADLDLASAGAQLKLVMNHGGARLGAPLTVHGAVGAAGLAALDHDGDGDVDLAVASRSALAFLLFENLGGGEYAPPRAADLAQPPFFVLAADLDADGLPDLATANQDTDTVSVLRNLGRGAFAPPQHIPVGRDPRVVVAGDVDLDGDVDLVSGNHTSGDLTVLFNESLRLPRPYLERICTPLDFHLVSAPSRVEGMVVRATKYVAPAEPGDPELLPVVFQDVRRFPLHQEFLAQVFPERFPLLDGDAYDALVGRRATRRYFVGSVRLLDTDEGPLYGFDLATSYLADPRELPRLEEVRRVLAELEGGFSLGPLAYLPERGPPSEDARTWGNPGFPIVFPETGPDPGYEAYTRATGYGRVRILRADEFEDANRGGRLSFQDILVLERAPRDIEGVVGGVITAEPQGDLSHLAVRTARRGTPNAYLRGALESFAEYRDRLVRLDVLEGEHRVSEATVEEAEAWWTSSRPRPSELPQVDKVHDALESLEEIDLSARPESRYGGKAANLARLQRTLTGEFSGYREAGFSIPVRYYLEFLRATRLSSALDPARQVTYEEYLDEVFAWETFQSDSELRHSVLARLREHMEERGSVPLSLIRRLAVRIEEVFGSASLMVRFRSSSNAEDVLEFNGAGLYDSTSACAADDADADSSGPSRCDATRGNERRIARALRRVWSSLWNFRAYEERAFFGLPQQDAAMAVLVTRAFLDERVNGVALTGNPSDPFDGRYVVVAQRGEASVVSPDPGVVAEKSLVRIDGRGGVTEIVRASRSSLVPEGEFVLSEAELEEIGRFLWHADRSFPVERGSHARDDVLLDIEFKVESTGDLAVKQIRPFLRGEPRPPAPDFELVVPEGAEACGAFVHSRPPRDGFELKSRVRFIPGRIELGTKTDLFEGELFSEVSFGAEGNVARSTGPGTFRVSRSGEDPTTYRFEFAQSFLLPEGDLYELLLENLVFRALGEEPVDPVMVLDEEYLSRRLLLRGALESVPLVSYGSCSWETLRLFEIELEAADRTSLRLLERHEPPRMSDGTGPAALVGVEGRVRGVRLVETTSYWELVYAAARHNRSVRYWIALDPPRAFAALPRPVRILEVVAPEPLAGLRGGLRYLDENFEWVGGAALVSYERREAGPPAAVLFVRGDASGDGRVNLTDAVVLLSFLFGSGAAPSCLRAADADDDGRLNLTDAVVLLTHLFRTAEPLPAPHTACGADLTPDDLVCASYPACEGK